MRLIPIILTIFLITSPLLAQEKKDNTKDIITYGVLGTLGALYLGYLVWGTFKDQKEKTAKEEEKKRIEQEEKDLILQKEIDKRNDEAEKEGKKREELKLAKKTKDKQDSSWQELVEEYGGFSMFPFGKDSDKITKAVTEAIYGPLVWDGAGASRKRPEKPFANESHFSEYFNTLTIKGRKIGANIYDVIFKFDESMFYSYSIKIISYGSSLDEINKELSTWRNRLDKKIGQGKTLNSVSSLKAQKLSYEDQMKTKMLLGDASIYTDTKYTCGDTLDLYSWTNEIYSGEIAGVKCSGKGGYNLLLEIEGVKIKAKIDSIKSARNKEEEIKRKEAEKNAVNDF